MNTLAPKKYEPEPIEFIHALKGSPSTLIFWTILLIWLGKTFAPCFKQSAPITKATHLGFLAIFGIFWALLEFALSLSEICQLMLEIGSYSPIMIVEVVAYSSYAVLWILLETSVAICLALLAALFWRKRNLDPNRKSAPPLQRLS